MNNKSDGNDHLGERGADGEPSLIALLATTSAERARMECTGYYHAESVFFRAMQVALGALPPASDEEPCGLCGHPFGPSHWLSVFQLACQLTQPDVGDLILCALFGPLHEAERDWKTENDAAIARYADQAGMMVTSILRLWPDFDALVRRYLPEEYSLQCIGVLRRAIVLSVTRWLQDEADAQKLPPLELEGTHPALVAAAHACLDADYIHSCVWKLREPSPELAYTSEGRRLLQQLRDN